MISKECFTTEWIEKVSREFNYKDKNLIEKVIRAARGRKSCNDRKTWMTAHISPGTLQARRQWRVLSGY